LICNYNGEQKGPNGEGYPNTKGCWLSNGNSLHDCWGLTGEPRAALCVENTPSEKISCSDSDGGNDYSVSGYTKSCIGSDCTKNYDTCYDDQVVERSCLNNFSTITTSICASGCSAGVCKTAPATCPVIITRDLMVGSTGKDVSNLQTFLGLTATGYFGASTKSAVISFQTISQISPADGVVGAATRAFLSKIDICPYVWNNSGMSLTVISPNGGETLDGGDTYTIKWSMINIPYDSKIIVDIFQYQGNDDLFGNPNHQIVSLSSGVSSYKWTVQGNDGSWGLGMNVFKKIASILGVKTAIAYNDQYKISVRTASPDFPNVYIGDVSDSYFKIISPTDVTPVIDDEPIPTKPPTTTPVETPDTPTPVISCSENIVSGNTCTQGNGSVLVPTDGTVDNYSDCLEWCASQSNINGNTCNYNGEQKGPNREGYPNSKGCWISSGSGVQGCGGLTGSPLSAYCSNSVSANAVSNYAAASTGWDTFLKLIQALR
jgi:hypothetical protein